MNGVIDIVERFLLQPGRVGVLQSSGGEMSGAVLEALEDELSFGLEEEGGTVKRCCAATPLGLVEQVHKSDHRDVILVLGVEAFDDAAIRELDAERNRLSGPGILMVTTKEAAIRLAQLAPNLWSWIGESVWEESQPEIADAEKRLQSLREATCLTDAGVIALAKAGTLPSDPMYTEWLVLLGRGELI